MSPSPTTVTAVSRCTVVPDRPSALGKLKLTVSDLPMLSCHYIQKGVLFTRPTIPSSHLLPLLRRALSRALSHFPPLAGRLSTDADDVVYIDCNDAGVEFVHAVGNGVTVADVMGRSPEQCYSDDVPAVVKEFFVFDCLVSYQGHFRPLAAVQVTELADGLFVGITVNHSVVDGTSFWNFFNSWAEICRGAEKISRPPVFRRSFIHDSPAVIRFPPGGPAVSFDATAPIRERIFHFSADAISELKSRANGWPAIPAFVEIFGKAKNDDLIKPKGGEISSFQSLCAQLWKSVTKARKLLQEKETTFRMAVNCRHRVEPAVDKYYFGNAIQSIRTVAAAGDIVGKDLGHVARLLHLNVAGYNDGTIRKMAKEWEKEPRVFPLGNPDGASITMGSSPRFPMYDNNMGWGLPAAVRSGRANKFDGKISAFPGRDGGGSVDLEVCLSPETMAGLEADPEFMQYVTILL